jgi:hypothetical protein
MSGHLDHGMYDPAATNDIVQGSARCTDAQTYFRAILTDGQVEVIEKACARFLDDDAEWLANPPTDADYEQLAGALVAVQCAEKIL